MIRYTNTNSLQAASFISIIKTHLLLLSHFLSFPFDSISKYSLSYSYSGISMIKYVLFSHQLSLNLTVVWSLSFFLRLLICCFAFTSWIIYLHSKFCFHSFSMQTHRVRFFRLMINMDFEYVFKNDENKSIDYLEFLFRIYTKQTMKLLK